MDLDGIYQLRVEGCTFHNDETPPVSSYLYSSLNGIGIRTIDASVVVTPLCTTQTVPCGGQIRNQFINLHNAIHITQPLTTQGYSTLIKEADFTGNYRAVYANSPQLLQVKQCSLVNNYRGVYLLNSQGAMVTENLIQIPDYDPNMDLQLPYGLYLDGGTGFKVEENNFYNNYNYGGTYGMIVHNTGAVSNEIYKNSFSGLNIGIQPQLRNKGNIQSIDVGLCLFCNEFANPGTDIRTTGKSASWIYRKNIGIHPAQQISTWNSNTSTWYRFPAGNSFSQSHTQYTPGVDDHDFCNGDAEYLSYYHENNTTSHRYLPDRSSNISNYFLVGSATQCQSKSGTGLNQSYNYASLATARVAWQSSKLIRDIWKNYGIEDLGEQIETVEPWEVYEEFNSLMAMSPYLSEDVLIAMVLNQAFSALMVKLVCVANPQASHSDGVMEALYSRIPAMPEPYMEEIMDASGSYSPLEQLEGEVAADYHLFRTIGEDIKRAYQMDSINSWAGDSLIAFLSRQPGLSDRYSLALTYLQFGQVENMITTLENIPGEFILDEQLSEEHQQYLTTFGIAMSILLDSVLPGELDSTQLTDLEDILQNEATLQKSFAIALLKWNNPNYYYDEPILDPPAYQQRKSIMHKPPVLTQKQILITPNPARDYLIIQWHDTRIENHQYSIAFQDGTGRTVLTQQLNSGFNESLIDIHNLIAGVYHAIVFENNNPISIKKIVVFK